MVWVICKIRTTNRVGKLTINGIDYWEIMTPFHFGPKGMAKGSIVNFVSIGAWTPTRSYARPRPACARS